MLYLAWCTLFKTHIQFNVRNCSWMKKTAWVTATDLPVPHHDFGEKREYLKISAISFFVCSLDLHRKLENFTTHFLPLQIFLFNSGAWALSTFSRFVYCWFIWQWIGWTLSVQLGIKVSEPSTSKSSKQFWRDHWERKACLRHVSVQSFWYTVEV